MQKSGSRSTWRRTRSCGRNGKNGSARARSTVDSAGGTSVPAVQHRRAPAALVGSSRGHEPRGPEAVSRLSHERVLAGFLSSSGSACTPGITGLWQITIRSDGGIDEQVAYDSYYIRNWSVWLDIYILSRTIAAVAAGRGAY